VKPVTLLPLLLAIAAPALAAEMRPNVLFIYADDWGWGDRGLLFHGLLPPRIRPHLVLAPFQSFIWYTAFL
jgi:hypothetical protein